MVRGAQRCDRGRGDPLQRGGTPADDFVCRRGQLDVQGAVITMADLDGDEITVAKAGEEAAGGGRAEADRPRHGTDLLACDARSPGENGENVVLTGADTEFLVTGRTTDADKARFPPGPPVRLSAHLSRTEGPPAAGRGR